MKFLKNNNPKLLVYSGGNYNLLPINRINYIKAERSYSKVVLVNDESYLHSKNLKAFETTLSGFRFIRINRSIIVNIDQIQEYKFGISAAVQLQNGKDFFIGEVYKSGLHKFVSQNLIYVS